MMKLLPCLQYQFLFLNSLVLWVLPLLFHSDHLEILISAFTLPIPISSTQIIMSYRLNFCNIFKTWPLNSIAMTSTLISILHCIIAISFPTVYPGSLCHIYPENFTVIAFLEHNPNHRDTLFKNQTLEFPLWHSGLGIWLQWLGSLWRLGSWWIPCWHRSQLRHRFISWLGNLFMPWCAQKNTASPATHTHTHTHTHLSICLPHVLFFRGCRITESEGRLGECIALDRSYSTANQPHCFCSSPSLSKVSAHQPILFTIIVFMSLLGSETTISSSVSGLLQSSGAFSHGSCYVVLCQFSAFLWHFPLKLFWPSLLGSHTAVLTALDLAWASKPSTLPLHTHTHTHTHTHRLLSQEVF